MIKVEVIQNFSFSRFNEIKNIIRKSTDKEGMLYVGDTFECSQEIAEYLTGKNGKGIVTVKVIEIIPEKEIKKEVIIDLDENKNVIKKASKKKTSKK